MEKRCINAESMERWCEVREEEEEEERNELGTIKR